MVSALNGLKAAVLVTAAFVTSGLQAQDQQKSKWSTNCVSYDRNSPAQCSMNHVVTVQETGQVLFNVTLRVAKTKGQMPFLDIIAPLGFFLPRGLSLSVDGNELFNLPIQRCDNKGCFAGVVLSSEQLGLLEDGDSLAVTFSPNMDQSAEVKVPLTGFTDSYAKIKH